MFYSPLGYLAGIMVVYYLYTLRSVYTEFYSQQLEVYTCIAGSNFVFVLIHYNGLMGIRVV